MSSCSYFLHLHLRWEHALTWSPYHNSVTTANGTVRFNPNLYSNGKVCLSILGTWSGPSWTSVQTMNSTLISIQSLMNYAPYHNEPGFEAVRNFRDFLMRKLPRDLPDITFSATRNVMVVMSRHTTRLSNMRHYE